MDESRVITRALRQTVANCSIVLGSIFRMMSTRTSSGTVFRGVGAVSSSGWKVRDSGKPANMFAMLSLPPLGFLTIVCDPKEVDSALFEGATESEVLALMDTALIRRSAPDRSVSSFDSSA